MPIEIGAYTEAGARLVTIAEHLSEQLASRAAEHDREGTYPFEAIDALKPPATSPRPSQSSSAGSASPPATT